MRIRYNLNAFLVLIAIVAISCFFLVGIYRYQRFKGIPEGSYKVTATFDEKGVDLEILSSTVLLKQVEIRCWNENTNDTSLTSKVMTFDSATEKTFRIELGMVDQIVTDPVGQKTRIILPEIHNGEKLLLANAKRRRSSGYHPPHDCIEIYQFINDLQETIYIAFYIQ